MRAGVVVFHPCKDLADLLGGPRCGRRPRRASGRRRRRAWPPRGSSRPRRCRARRRRSGRSAGVFSWTFSRTAAMPCRYSACEIAPEVIAVCKSLKNFFSASSGPAVMPANCLRTLSPKSSLSSSWARPRASLKPWPSFDQSLPAVACMSSSTCLPSSATPPISVRHFAVRPLTFSTVASISLRAAALLSAARTCWYLSMASVQALSFSGFPGPSSSFLICSSISGCVPRSPGFSVFSLAFAMPWVYNSLILAMAARVSFDCSVISPTPLAAGRVAVLKPISAAVAPSRLVNMSPHQFLAFFSASPMFARALAASGETSDLGVPLAMPFRAGSSIAPDRPNSSISIRARRMGSGIVETALATASMAPWGPAWRSCSALRPNSFRAGAPRSTSRSRRRIACASCSVSMPAERACRCQLRKSGNETPSRSASLRVSAMPIAEETRAVVKAPTEATPPRIGAESHRVAEAAGEEPLQLAHPPPACSPSR